MVFRRVKKSNGDVLPCTSSPSSQKGHRYKRKRRRVANKVQSYRVPYLVWIMVISIYCCIMYMQVGVNRMRKLQYTINGLDYDNNKKTQSSSHNIQATKQTSKQNTRLQTPKYEIDPELIHVVETRFMQQQSGLLELGLARLALFEAFCLPSMLSQTSSNFLWIIRADPKLHPSLVKRLQELLKGRDNFILIGSNNNPEGFGRDGTSLSSFLQADSMIDNVTAHVWSGNITLLEEAYKYSSSRSSILLETRLDSDDGLHSQFIEYVQNDTVNNLVSKDIDKKPWRLWCIDSRIEFHPWSPWDPSTPEILEAKTNEIQPQEGYLVLFSEKVCVTPGMTFGYGKGANRESLDIPHLRHDQIASKIKKCVKDTQDIECVKRLEIAPGAVRARTTTSAGMANVVTGKEDIDKANGFRRKAKNKNFIRQYFRQDSLWAILSTKFTISRDEVKVARAIIIDRETEIAQDNLKGQCTGGHSCKNSTKKILQTLGVGLDNNNSNLDEETH